MRLKIIASLMAVSCLVALSSPAAATDWAKAATGSDGTIIYIDRDTITQTGARILAWEKWDYTTATHDAKRAYVVEKDRREYDCAAGTSRIREAIEYSADGSVLRTFSWVAGETQYHAAPPESMGAATLAFVCGGERSPPPG